MKYSRDLGCLSYLKCSVLGRLQKRFEKLMKNNDQQMCNTAQLHHAD